VGTKYASREVADAGADYKKKKAHMNYYFYY
jgi:hypothetical protein